MKPAWLKVPLGHGQNWKKMDGILIQYGLHTVCNEAMCPNKAECWGSGTATFMVLGDTCTRGCRFCAVKTAAHSAPPDPLEPSNLAKAVVELGLSYAVITSVDRDDLSDRGSAHFAECIAAIKKAASHVKIEVLIPDYRGAELDIVVNAKPDVIAHNVETVRRLQSIRDARANLDLSLQTLYEIKQKSSVLSKTSIMLGLGESEAEVLELMDELRAVSCDILVLGQYLQPSKMQIAVKEYITPEQFKIYANIAKQKGFLSVVSSPLARTSYHAKESHVEAL